MSKSDPDFYRYMGDAMGMPPNDEYFVGDFTVFLLMVLEYNAGYRVIHGKEVGLEMKKVTEIKTVPRLVTS